MIQVGFKVNIMHNIKFVEGDVVELKSGGPRMTVIGVEETLVKCVWWDPNPSKLAGEIKNHHCYAEFPKIALKRLLAEDEETR